mmetsp:Transcript_24109/g.57309  ORF Transcript_24109/g.57309 Transcript_24109/m.57309 type:complete len:358 (+) Transcript_24109:451-1524(+)
MLRRALRRRMPRREDACDAVRRASCSHGSRSRIMRRQPRESSEGRSRRGRRSAVDVGSEHQRHPVVPECLCGVQRRAILIAQFAVSLCIEQLSDHALRVRVRCYNERRDRVIGGAIDVSVALDQQARQRCAVALRGCKQWRRAVHIRLVHVGLIRDQQRHHLFLVALDGHVQRRAPSLGSRANICLAEQQQLGDVGLSILRCNMQRGVSRLALLVEVGFGSDERGGDRVVSVHRGPMQRSPTHHVGEVDVCLCLQQDRDALFAALLDRDQERRIHLRAPVGWLVDGLSWVDEVVPEGQLGRQRLNNRVAEPALELLVIPDIDRRMPRDEADGCSKVRVFLHHLLCLVHPKLLHRLAA